MKLVRAESDRLHLECGPREKQLLWDLLRHFPRVPPAHHRPSHRPDDIPAESRQLLAEQLAAQRAANARRVPELLHDPRRFVRVGRQYRWTLSLADVEWLLQVLNDIRVGSWIALGCPEEQDRRRLTRLSTEEVAFFRDMELAAYFEAELLEALDGGAPS